MIFHSCWFVPVRARLMWIKVTWPRSNTLPLSIYEFSFRKQFFPLYHDSLYGFEIIKSLTSFLSVKSFCNLSYASKIGVITKTKAPSEIRHNYSFRLFAFGRESSPKRRRLSIFRFYNYTFASLTLNLPRKREQYDKMKKYSSSVYVNT